MPRGESPSAASASRGLWHVSLDGDVHERLAHLLDAGETTAAGEAVEVASHLGGEATRAERGLDLELCVVERDRWELNAFDEVDPLDPAGARLSRPAVSPTRSDLAALLSTSMARICACARSPRSSMEILPSFSAGTVVSSCATWRNACVSARRGRIRRGSTAAASDPSTRMRLKGDRRIQVELLSTAVVFLADLPPGDVDSRRDLGTEFVLDEFAVEPVASLFRQTRPVVRAGLRLLAGRLRLRC